MSAPLDLTGRTFGALTVLHRDGQMVWGRLGAAWLCQCRCGVQVRVAQNRLPHRASIRQDHRIEACPECSAKPCKQCGVSNAIIGVNMRRYCSDRCRDLARQHRKDAQRPPGYREALESDRERHRALKAAMTPEKRAAAQKSARDAYRSKIGKEQLNARSRVRHLERMATEPEYAERKRRTARGWIENNRERRRRAQRDYTRHQRARLIDQALPELAGKLAQLSSDGALESEEGDHHDNLHDRDDDAQQAQASGSEASLVGGKRESAQGTPDRQYGPSVSRLGKNASESALHVHGIASRTTSE